jgi:hypothetical protein
MVYWIAGAVVSFGGAIGARLLAQAAPPSQRVPIWLMGGVFIFIGLAILSMGTRARLEDEALFADEDGQGGNDNDRQPGKSDPPQPAGPPA